MNALCSLFLSVDAHYLYQQQRGYSSGPGLLEQHIFEMKVTLTDTANCSLLRDGDPERLLNQKHLQLYLLLILTGFSKPHYLFYQC